MNFPVLLQIVISSFPTYTGFQEAYKGSEKIILAKSLLLDQKGQSKNEKGKLDPPNSSVRKHTRELLKCRHILFFMKNKG